MKHNFNSSLNALKPVISKFDESASRLKTALLKTLSLLKLPAGKKLSEYHDQLLFLSAYPGNKKEYELAIKELNRIALLLKKNKVSQNSLYENEGLPSTAVITRFSPDFLNWLIKQKDLNVYFDSFYHPVLTLNEVLQITLPSLLKAQTSAGLNNEALLQTLQVKPVQYIPFLLDQLQQLAAWPQVMDLLLEKLDLYVKLVPTTLQFSRAFNRIPVPQVYYQQELLKHFDHEELVNRPLIPDQQTAVYDKQLLIKVTRYAMALTARETDTATYLQEDSVKFFPLERGISIVLYGMVAHRQLPLESYVGFTLFKNGLPVAYGGAWVFGARARIGINIAEAFRGGESGYILCQLLRVYKQVFGVSFFEAEPYQYGLDNPDGITSGAFWFYYRYGFRPVNRELLKLSKTEYQKIRTKKNYRSAAKTLLRFTESNIALNLGKKVPPDVAEVSAKLLSVLKKGWQQNNKPLLQEAVSHFCKLAGIHTGTLSTAEKNVLQDVALWAFAMKITKRPQLELMKQMVVIKPKDLYAYQQLLLDFFKEN